MSTNHFARFKFNALERWIPLPLILLCVIAAWNSISQYQILFALSVLLSLYWIYRLVCVWSYHFIIFEESGIIIRKGLFFLPYHLKFIQITNIRTIKPDKHIHFQVDESHEIHLPLSRLTKEDRIRFIFLIESDVNRISINASL
ncbi:hypothetical protein ACFL4L_05930 [bacterium]